MHYLTYDLHGGAGGGNTGDPYASTAGGRGAEVSGTVPVTPGQNVLLTVGQDGNGGGWGGTRSGGGNDKGDSTYILRGGGATSLTTSDGRVLAVAGGGGASGRSSSSKFGAGGDAGGSTDKQWWGKDATPDATGGQGTWGQQSGQGGATYTNYFGTAWGGSGGGGYAASGGGGLGGRVNTPSFLPPPSAGGGAAGSSYTSQDTVDGRIAIGLPATVSNFDGKSELLFTSNKPSKITTISAATRYISAEDTIEDAKVNLAAGIQSGNASPAVGSQRWVWVPNPDPDKSNYAQLVNLFSGRCLDISGQDGTSLLTHTCKAMDDPSIANQMWTTKEISALKSVQVQNPSDDTGTHALMSQTGQYLFYRDKDTVTTPTDNATLWNFDQ
ncbi:RICIN domain-containing protein [Streptomyces sp. NPDC058272]|uniref:RICIN domain-containing protein n=1 Tax=Streptomyces sp. NPDC058272 TaxID=3346415 RepID=UPI0036E234EF